MSNYIIKSGDCIASIAYKHRITWQKIWNHPKNNKLRQRRTDPSVLMPGDVIFIPKKEKFEVTVSTDQHHRFLKKSVVSYLHFQLLDEEHQPRPNESYVLNVDGMLYNGTTDTDGFIQEVIIAPDAQKAILSVTEGNQQLDYEFMLGYLDPEDEIKGIQERLSNLGLYTGKIDGIAKELTKEGVRAFQKQHKLEQTGELDNTTRQQIKQVHGC